MNALFREDDKAGLITNEQRTCWDYAMAMHAIIDLKQHQSLSIPLQSPLQYTPSHYSESLHLQSPMRQLELGVSDHDVGMTEQEKKDEAEKNEIQKQAIRIKLSMF